MLVILRDRLTNLFPSLGVNRTIVNRIMRFCKSASTLWCAAVVAVSCMASASTLPRGSRLAVRLENSVTSRTAVAGQSWRGELIEPVVVHGETLAPAGAEVDGVVSAAHRSGRLHHPGFVSLRVTTIDGKRVRTEAYRRAGRGHKRGNLAKIGGGTVTGATVGAIVGGPVGAAAGAASGAVVGTTLALFTGRHDVTIPAESIVHFRVE